MVKGFYTHILELLINVINVKQEISFIIITMGAADWGRVALNL